MTTAAFPQKHPDIGWISRLATATAVLVALIYAGFLAQRLPILPLEQGQAAAGPAYRALGAGLRAVASDGIVWARVLGVLLVGIAAIATARLAGRIAGDATLGAFVALLWPMLPTAVALMALAIPTGAVVTLTTLGLVALWPGAAPSPRRDGLGAAALTLAALLDPFGAWNALAAAFLIVLIRRRAWPLLGPAIGAALAVIATTPISGLEIPAVQEAGGLLEAARPYVFVWVAGLLGAVASRHRRVRAELGFAGTQVCRVAPVLYAATVALASAESVAAGGIAGTAGLPFALMGLIPLGVWIRKVMPGITVVWAWIAFPVVLYGGFSLILGPVRPDRFPYAQLRATIGFELYGNGLGDLASLPLSARKERDY